MIESVYNMPAWLLGFAVTGGFVLFAVGTHLVMHRWVREHWSGERDSVGFIVSSTATLYAVLLALIAVAVWTNYTATEDHVRDEANMVANLYRDAEGLSAAGGAQLRGELRGYAKAVIEKEWPQMRLGNRPGASDAAATDLMTHVLRMRPTSLGEANVQSEILATLNAMFELRRVRQESVRKGLPPVLWAVVVVGGVVTIALANLLAADDRRLSVLLSAGLATMIGLQVFLIFSMDRPLMGRISVEPVAFEQVVRRMDALDLTIRPSTSRPSGSEPATRSGP